MNKRQQPNVAASNARPAFIISIVLTVLSIACWIWFFFIRADEIAYIDAGRVLQEYRGAKVAREAYESKAAQWQLNIDTLGRELQQAITDFETEGPRMALAAREARKREIAAKQRQFQDYQQATQQNAQQEDQKITGEVIADINRLLKTYGERHDYKYILIASQAGTIAYAEDGLDITDDVLTALNADYGKE